MSVGIMQGRLSPPEGGRFQSFPRSGWREEFAAAAAAGLSSIEWIWDVYGADVNPLANDNGVAEMKALSDRHAVTVRSVCADYFMDCPLVRVAGAELEARREALVWLVGRCGSAGIGRIVLPFVDASRIESLEDSQQLVEVLNSALPVAEAAGVELHLETDLSPSSFAILLASLPHRLIGVNYDSGNSASLGFRPIDEFKAYGDRVGSVHIKDRIQGDGTVPLGTGDTDFSSLSLALREADYRGDFVLQAARGQTGDEVAWSKQNRLFAEAHGFCRTGP